MGDVTRRTFVMGAGALAAAAAGVRRAGARERSDRLRLAIVGVGGRGAGNLRAVAPEEIVALCDVDERPLRAAMQAYPRASTYVDFRAMLDDGGLDAVVISTPDHTHACVSLAAMSAGLHVYCEKPLCRTVAEVRDVSELARRRGLVTQHGTQIHAGSNYRRVVELVRSGAIGVVREVHTWVGGGFDPVPFPTDTPPLPPGLHWDLWLGPSALRPYHPEIAPFRWRRWWAYGNGQLGDFGCHHMDLAHWALDLRDCVRVEAEGPPPHQDSAPPWLVVRYDYPARGDQPPVRLTWYNGDRRPPQMAEGAAPAWAAGNLFVGSRGMLIADYGRHELLPARDFEGFVPPPASIPDSMGHHREWLEAIRTGGTTTCNFDYAGALTETVLLGNVAYRVGEALEWDARALRARNSRAAADLIRQPPRAGWQV
ncbi:MAG TPA: Gfo/Idh/MocA family oxidoreductase [Chthonomonadales bacterium]|nr:Gfo/Idh/MocA family oxidoreductase [Chthonomonadales bacterium]